MLSYRLTPAPTENSFTPISRLTSLRNSSGFHTFAARLRELGRGHRVQVEHRLPAKVVQHLPGPRAAQVRVLLDGEGGFDNRLVFALQPPAHEPGHRLAVYLRVAVRRVGFDDVQFFRDSEQRVNPLRLAEGRPRAADVEEVARGSEDERRLRGVQEHVVGVVDAERDLTRDVLLRVLRADGVEQPFERGEVARRRRRDDTIIEPPSGRK